MSPLFILIQGLCKFHDYDQPSKEYFDKTKLSLIWNSLVEIEKQWTFFNELEDCKLDHVNSLVNLMPFF